MTIAFDNSFRVSFRPLPELTPAWAGETGMRDEPKT